jgi:hypothetical protein
VVADRHAVPAAQAAAQQPGQQRLPVPGSARGLRGLLVGGQPGEVRAVLVLGDVGGKPARQHDQPLAGGLHHFPGVRAAGDLPAGIDLTAAVGVIARVSRVAQHVLQRLPGRAPPFQVALRRPRARADRKLDLVPDEIAQHGVEGPQPLEGPEDKADDVLRLLVGVEGGLAGRAAHVSGREREDQLAALGLGPLRAQHPLPDQENLCLAHRPLQPQQQAVVVIPRIVDRVRVSEKRPRQRAQLQQVVPVLPGPRQPRHLDPQDDPRPSHGDLSDKPGEALPGIRDRRGHPEVVVDHDDLGPGPAQRDRPPGERVLQPRRFRVLKDLAPGRLPDIHDRGQGQVLRPDLQLRQSLRMHDRVHRDRLPPRPRPVPRASPAAPPPSSAALAAPPPRSAGREPPSFRCPVASGSPAAASRRPTVAAACNSAPTLSIAPDAPGTLETISSSRVSAVAD